MGQPASWGSRRRLVDWLDRLHLARPALRAYELMQAVRAGAACRPTQGLPLPSARLRVQVGPEAADADLFLRSGQEHAEFVRGLLDENGRSIETMGAILDWGCGCGRVLRHWAYLSPTVRICGCDINARAIRWCESHLPFVAVEVNDIPPPFPYPDSTFDLVYALSVFTHLPEELQYAWMRECRRVLKPDGSLLFTTMGERYLSLDRLTDSERQEFRSGRIVVLYQSVAGSNLCSVYHPPAYVKESLSVGFELRSFVPGRDSFPQDAYLFAPQA